LRWLLRVVDISLSSGGVAMLTILLNGKGQRLGDIAAGTTVIKLKEDVGLQDTIFTKITDAYQPVFAQAAELNDQDMAIVREVLNTGLEVESIEVGNNLEMKAKIVLEEKMRIKSDLPPRAFLSTILRDYNYFKGKL
jgi:hypothetical protein